MSRKLEDLIPLLAIKAVGLREKVKAELDFEILYTHTWRSFPEQKALYSQGRQDGGRIVTHAQAGESFHNYGLAFDFVPLVGGQPDWDDEGKFLAVGEMGEDLGLQWGGRWLNRKRDLPHFQMSFGLNIAALKELYYSGGIAKVWEECNRKYETGLWP